MINILLSLRIFDQKQVQQAIKKYVHKEHKVCVLAYSFFQASYPTKALYEAYYSENGPYYEKIKDSFLNLDIQSNHISWIDYYHDDIASSIKKIEEADIIYFPGGAPDEMMMRIHEKRLDETLKNAHKIYIGVSAGAMIQFKDFYMSPDHDYPSFKICEGLGFIDNFYVEVHYQRRKKQKSSIRKVWRKHHKDMYVIPNDGCIIVDDTGIHMIQSAKQMYNKKGIIKL